MAELFLYYANAMPLSNGPIETPAIFGCEAACAADADSLWEWQ